MTYLKNFPEVEIKTRDALTEFFRFSGIQKATVFTISSCLFEPAYRISTTDKPPLRASLFAQSWLIYLLRVLLDAWIVRVLNINLPDVFVNLEKPSTGFAYAF